MTNINYTHITAILDSSGSMASILNDTIGGFNTFLKAQKKIPGKCTFSQVHFSSGRWINSSIVASSTSKVPVLGPAVSVTPQIPYYNPFSSSIDPYYALNVFSPIVEVAELDTTTFVPGGGTPLLDCVARAIIETGDHLAGLSEDERPGKVLFAIITDGQENASTKYTRKQLFDLVKQQTEVYNWTFVYLGANQDAIGEAATFGIGAMYASSYACDSGSVNQNYSLLNTKVANFRSAPTVAAASASMIYTNEEKESLNNGTAPIPTA